MEPFPALDVPHDPARSLVGEPEMPRDPQPADTVHDAFWQLQESRLRYRERFDFASDGQLITNAQGVILEANYAAALLLNARKEFLIGKPLGLLLIDNCRTEFYGRLLRLTESQSMEQWEATINRTRETPRDVLLTVSIVSDDNGKPFNLGWVIRDVSMARQTERALLEERNLADCLVEASEIIILVVDHSGRILRCNPFLLAVSGYAADELTGHKWWERLLPTENHEEGQRLLRQGWIDVESKSGVLTLLDRTGGQHHVTWMARKLSTSLVLIGHDVTELQEAQQKALRNERLAAIGQVSAGLAHESRNALQRSQACLSVLLLRLHDQPEIVELLERMQHAQDDLQRLFDDVRAYASAPRVQPRLCNLRDVWREAWADLETLSSRKSAQFHEDVAETDLFCSVDPFYLKQVFRNLMENALACGAAPVRVAIRCGPASLESEAAIEIRLRDNGPGFPSENRRQLFEPFFTTKFRGTGLGLAICRRIVEAHGGRIEAGNDAEPGAEIVLTLPRRYT